MEKCKCTFTVKDEYNTIIKLGGKKINLRKADHNQMYAIAPWLYKRKLCATCKTASSFADIKDIKLN